MDYLNLIESAFLGAVFGALLMWFYWRKYRTTDAFKDEVNERWDEIKDFVKNKINSEGK